MPRNTPRARLTSPTPHTPSPSPLQFATSPSTSPQPSPSKRGNAGPVESTFQRAFRGTVKNYELIRKNWTMLHGQGVEVLKRLDRSTAALAKAQAFADGSAARGYAGGPAAATPRGRHRALLAAERAQESDQIQLFSVLDKLTRQYELLKAIRRQLSELLQEMCRRKSFEAAIEDPLFLTWSLSKFVDGFDTIIQLHLDAYYSYRDIVAATQEEEADEDSPAPLETLVEEWQARDLRDNFAILHFLDICQVELYNPLRERDDNS